VALGLVIAAIVVLSVRDYYSPVYRSACPSRERLGAILREQRPGVPSSPVPSSSKGQVLYRLCTPYSSP
jgi:hypothetical protein